MIHEKPVSQSDALWRKLILKQSGIQYGNMLQHDEMMCIIIKNNHPIHGSILVFGV